MVVAAWSSRSACAPVRSRARASLRSRARASLRSRRNSLTLSRSHTSSLLSPRDPRASIYREPPMPDARADLPNIGEVIAPILQQVQPRERPLLIALAERMAAERYRGWAAEPSQRSHRSGLLACAEREEAIARRVEALHPAAAALQRDLLAKHPGLERINRELFAGRPLADQFLIQARGERLGAATWRSLARRAEGEAEREVLLGCALLEEESAAFLESLIGA